METIVATAAAFTAWFAEIDLSALSIPLASLIIGGSGLWITVASRMNENERQELVALRNENKELRGMVTQLRDENLFLYKRVAGMPAKPEAT